MKVQVKISFKDKDVADVYIDESALPTQINVADNSTILEGVSGGTRGFQLSASTAAPVSKLDGKTPGFSSVGYLGIITSELSDAGGSCRVDIPFVLDGNTPENLYVEFDSAAKEYATYVSLESDYSMTWINIERNTSTLLVIPLAEFNLPDVLYDMRFVLHINGWSKANASIKITRIATYYTATYSGKDIISTSNSENSFDTQMQISPGICEQYIDVRLYDRIGALRQFARTDKLTPDYTISISALDGMDTYEMGTYIISEWSIDSTSSEVGVSGRDKSYLFEKINIKRSTIANRTLDNLINILFAQAEGMAWKYQDAETRQRCEEILVPDNWYLASDLYTMLNKICALGMLRIYWLIDAFVIGRCC
jgi:hypothetical protein